MTIVVRQSIAQLTDLLNIVSPDTNTMQFYQRTIGVQCDCVRLKVVIHLGSFAWVEEDDSHLSHQLRRPQNAKRMREAGLTQPMVWRFLAMRILKRASRYQSADDHFTDIVVIQAHLDNVLDVLRSDVAGEVGNLLISYCVGLLRQSACVRD